MAKNTAFHALETFIDSVDKVGTKETIKILQQGKSNLNEITKQQVNFIISEACKCYNITRLELLDTRTLHDRTEALAICFYLSNKLLGLKPAEMKIHFYKSNSQISRGMKRIRELDLKLPQDRKTKEKLMTIEDLCQKFFDSKK